MESKFPYVKKKVGCCFKFGRNSWTVITIASINISGPFAPFYFIFPPINMVQTLIRGWQTYAFVRVNKLNVFKVTTLHKCLEFNSSSKTKRHAVRTTADGAYCRRPMCVMCMSLTWWDLIMRQSVVCFRIPRANFNRLYKSSSILWKSNIARKSMYDCNNLPVL